MGRRYGIKKEARDELRELVIQLIEHGGEPDPAKLVPLLSMASCLMEQFEVALEAFRDRKQAVEQIEQSNLAEAELAELRAAASEVDHRYGEKIAKLELQIKELRAEAATVLRGRAGLGRDLFPSRHGYPIQSSAVELTQSADPPHFFERHIYVDGYGRARADRGQVAPGYRAARGVRDRDGDVGGNQVWINTHEIVRSCALSFRDIRRPLSGCYPGALSGSVTDHLTSVEILSYVNDPQNHDDQSRGYGGKLDT